MVSRVLRRIMAQGETTMQLFAQRLWDVLTGVYPPPQQREIPLVISLFYYSFTIFSGRILRLLNQRLVPSRLQLYVGDFLVSFMVHACSLENGMMRKYYGWTGYCLVLFALSMWFSLTIQTYQCNPRQSAIEYMKGGSTVKRTLLRAAFQLAGGLLSYQYARSVWALELSGGHSQRLKALHCVSDLRVPLLMGFAVEFGGSIIDTFLSITTFSSFQLSETTSKCLLGVAMTVLGVDATGFYLNPINASNQTYGCHGASSLEHVLVYWVGPLTATMLTVSLKQHAWEITKTMHRSKGTECLTGYQGNQEIEDLGSGIEDVPPQLVPAATRVSGDSEELVPTSSTRVTANGDLSTESSVRRRGSVKHRDSLDVEDVEAEYTDSLEQESDRSDLDVTELCRIPPNVDHSKNSVVKSCGVADDQVESLSSGTDEDLDKTIEVNDVEFDFEKLRSEKYTREDSGFETETNICTPSPGTEELFPGFCSENSEKELAADHELTNNLSEFLADEQPDSNSSLKGSSVNKKSSIPRLTPKTDTVSKSLSHVKSKIPTRKS